jgi:hypothetical protein
VQGGCNGGGQHIARKAPRTTLVAGNTQDTWQYTGDNIGRQERRSNRFNTRFLIPTSWVVTGAGVKV